MHGDSMPARNRLAAYVFSYNRGPFLRHCVETIRSCAPTVPLTVVDDGSTDAETLDVLDNLPVAVRRLAPGAGNAQRHGGLYANMQRALDDCDAEHLLFLQDDMQLVRPLRAADFEYLQAFFAHHPRAAFINPVFLKGQRARRDQRVTRLQTDFPVYFRSSPGKVRGFSYADVVIADVGRLRQAQWRFLPGEIENARRAEQLFGAMGFMAYPFAMFLPEVPVYRGKHMTWAVARAQQLGGTQPKVYALMDAAQCAALFDRDLSVLPVAENFLRCTDPHVRRPFQYSAVNAYPGLRVLHKLEQWLRG
jgi:glycosyltransferase involved in cell wall biosynthesis